MFGGNIFSMECLICFKHHSLSSCPIFKTYTVKQRAYTVRAHRYCSNCFSRSHTAMGCTSIGRCLKCGEPHHTMLHPDNNEAKKNESILPAQQCLLKDPLTIPRKTQTPLERVAQHAPQRRKRQSQKQRRHQSCLDDSKSVSKTEDEDFETYDDTERVITNVCTKLEEEELKSDNGLERDEIECTKNEVDDDSNSELDKSGRNILKGRCYICQRDSKWKRTTRQTCFTCKNPVCVQHYFTQTKCKDCHLDLFKNASLFASNSDDKEFEADDLEERDASGRLKQKGACNMCYREVKRRRATRKACVACKKPVCAQHYIIQTRCEGCYTGPSKTSEIT